ncbi:MAG: T9SS type A sorting domain-containing protein [Saprospiraceae bacterium]|nr:T9SS type A sorting domain-containing protein [Saprospiraceae bacterium]
MLKSTLLSAAFLLTLGVGQSFAQAQTVVNEAEAPAFYVDETPKFKGLQKVYTIDKIEYTEQRTIVHFRFMCDNAVYGGATYYPPKTSDSWILQDKHSDRVFDAIEIRNVRQNGTVKIENVTAMESLWSDWQEAETTYECEIHFDRLPSDVNVAHLFEGTNQEANTERFSCLNIKLKTWNEPTEVIEPEVVVEEIDEPKEATTPEITINSPNVALNWKAYPNPVERVLFVELDEVQDAQLQLMSINGQLVWQGQTQDKVTQVDMSNLPSGTYLMTVTVGDQTTTKQVIKK